MTRVLLARHGRTALNADGLLRGLADPPLDRRGRAEAAALADALRAAFGSDAVTAVLASPLQRAQQTARAVAGRFGVESVASDPGFTDRDYGEWTGQPRDEVVARFGSVDAAPGVQPEGEVVARARAELDAVADAHPEQTVVVVSHDAVIRPLVESLEGAGTDFMLPTGSWCELVRTGREWTVVSVGNSPVEAR
ncbi:histidine phosphatase family protein [Protaetiibacter mangrovi]|uniref:Histidine phosphatase family protein n=1 Tax=Protaetiibacter mangrovi TaxID=2970926 RepID=A0ABT1ZEP8_9MICO|nr:histidine phosphatase family protein [Protaetiibacter mangrovi]MCS0499186.1 histidine phosphatase family protein [Protaetiibacter mangrovi]TPX03311.1 histidine phosphatase family protein [Schumannella luteola]